MPIFSTIQAFTTHCSQGRLLGIDVGSKTLGLATSDISHCIASPLCTLKRCKWKDTRVSLKKIMETHAVQGIIVGLPLHLDGTEGSRCRASRDFTRNFLDHFPYPCYLCDERFSTAAVLRTISDLPLKKQTQLVDQMAAAYILQNFLDQKRRLTNFLE